MRRLFILTTSLSCNLFAFASNNVPDFSYLIQKLAFRKTFTLFNFCGFRNCLHLKQSNNQILKWKFLP